MKLRRRPYVVGAGVILILGVLSLGLRCLAYYTNPRGLYEDEGIGALGISYYELGDGRVRFFTDGHFEEAGRYFKRDGIWIWVTKFGDEFPIVPRMTELQVLGKDGTIERSPYKRLFFRPKEKL